MTGKFLSHGHTQVQATSSLSWCRVRTHTFYTAVLLHRVDNRKDLTFPSIWRLVGEEQATSLRRKLSLCLSNEALNHEDVWGSGCIDHVFLTSAQSGGEWSASLPGRFNPRDRAPGTHRIGGGRGPREEEKNFAPTVTRTPTLGRPACSQTLYRLCYCGSNLRN
jgi:hypothetical protein